jgi:arylsulfatase A-like enzyme
MLKRLSDNLCHHRHGTLVRYYSRQAFLVLVALMFAAAPARAAEQPPNIVLLLVDDFAYDDVGCYGSQLLRTPNIDRLAAEGRRFTSYYAPSSVCTPTRAAIMTGCYAPRVGLPSVLYPQANIGLNPDETTIAELLRSRGYATACIGKWHLGHLAPFMPNEHGFDYFYGLPYPNDHGPERPNRDNPPIPLYRNAEIIEQPVDLVTLNDRIVDEAKQFIADHREQPFFLYLPFVGAHTPWYVAKRFQGQSKLGPYGDAVEEVDWGIGQVMAVLREEGLDENTLVVFASDNGPLFKPHLGLEEIYGDAGRLLPHEHLLREGKYTSAEGGVRVPMIARWPGVVPADTTCDDMCAGFDLYPTFAVLAGASAPTDRIVDGKNILPLIKGEPGAKTPHEEFFYFSNYDLEAVRSGDWKLRLVAHETPADGKKQRGLALYNLKDDLGETTNVASQHPEIVAKLKAKLKACRADLGDGPKRPGKNRRPPGKVGDAPARSD